MWRIGDGQNISIWADRWLPTPSSHRVQSPTKVLPVDAKVAVLILQPEKQWNIRLVREIFGKEEVETILKLPISASGAGDRVI